MDCSAAIDRVEQCKNTNTIGEWICGQGFHAFQGIVAVAVNGKSVVERSLCFSLINGMSPSEGRQAARGA